MTATVIMRAPAAFAAFVVSSGVTYTADASGLISSVPIAGTDVRDLINDGCAIASVASNVGAPATGVTAQEFGGPFGHTTILTMAGAVLPAIAGGANLGVGTLIYTLPAGAQIIRAARMNVGITQTTGHITADTPTVGLGTTIASGAVAVLSGTAAFQNIAVGKAAADCNGTKTVQTAKATASPFELVTETGGAKSIYFNAAFGWAASGDPAAILSGTVTIDWASLA